nr:LLM class flavin-dependent oxidoreductase [Pseudonocardia acidicola]
MNHTRLQSDMALSVLDTAPVVEGSTAREALRNAVDLASLADSLGYRRYWVAEHHGMKGVASCATSVIISEVAGATTRIRVGSGGILLPNHPPILIAEQFGTLEIFHPGRIDLGVGRAPGGSKKVVERVRPEVDRNAKSLTEQIEELLQYFSPPQPGGINVVPAVGNVPEIWMLGSGSESAALAGSLGLRYAFAAHLNPDAAVDAVHKYRSRFTAARDGHAPYVVLAVPVIAAETDSRAEWLAGSIRLKILSRRLGKRIRLPSPVDAAAYPYSDDERGRLAELTPGYVIGGPETIREGLQAVIDKTNANELIVTSPIFDHVARRQSYQILAGVGSRLRLEHSNSQQARSSTAAG